MEALSEEPPLLGRTTTYRTATPLGVGVVLQVPEIEGP